MPKAELLAADLSCACPRTCAQGTSRVLPVFLHGVAVQGPGGPMHRYACTSIFFLNRLLTGLSKNELREWSGKLEAPGQRGPPASDMQAERGRSALVTAWLSCMCGLRPHKTSADLTKREPSSQTSCCLLSPRSGTSLRYGKNSLHFPARQEQGDQNILTSEALSELHLLELLLLEDEGELSNEA